MQFCGFDLWKHLCKQANHVAAILNQKPCDFALIKFSAENYHVIVMWFLQILAIFKIKYRCLRFDIFIEKNKLVLAVKVDLINIGVNVIKDCYHHGQYISFLSGNHKITVYFWKQTLPTKAWLCI